MLPQFLSHGVTSPALSLLYGSDVRTQSAQLLRYRQVVSQFEQLFGEQPQYLFSSPGRCELGGNHTDHNGGRVLAAAINLDVLAAVTPSDSHEFTVYSEGFERPFVIDLSKLEPNHSEHPTTQLLRGIAAGFARRGHRVGGLNVFMSSDVLFASGLSSSAAIEVLFASILSNLFNQGELAIEEVAMIGREAEHIFWGKPVGLLDQLTIALGGVVHMSFRDPMSPWVEAIPVVFEDLGYQLVLVNPGGDHSALTSEYRHIPEEMKAVAKYFGKDRLIDTTISEVLASVAELRTEVGDRAILRALHFFSENERVELEAQAVQDNNMQEFLKHVRNSGYSSWRLLQNCYEAAYPSIQPISLALAVTEVFGPLKGHDVGYRVHGGGFGGTILAIVPSHTSEAYITRMNQLFGASAAHLLRLRSEGCVDVGELELRLNPSHQENADRVYFG